MHARSPADPPAHPVGNPPAARGETPLILAWIGLTFAVVLLLIVLVVVYGGPAADILLVIAPLLYVFGRAALIVPFLITAALCLAGLLLGLRTPHPLHVVLVVGGGLAASIVGLVLVAGIPLP